MKKFLLFLVPCLLVACSGTTPIIQPNTVSQEVSPAPVPEVSQPEKKSDVPPQKVEKKEDTVAQNDTSDPTTDDLAQELDNLIEEMTRK